MYSRETSFYIESGHILECINVLHSLASPLSLPHHLFMKGYQQTANAHPSPIVVHTDIYLLSSVLRVQVR